MKIAFVCTGNTCRSSMAEALAKNWLAANAPTRTDIMFASAGLAAFPGSPASAQSIDVMRLAGIDLTCHRAKQISGDLVAESDLIITMTKGHKHALLEMYPESVNKIYTLAEFAAGQDADISDPFARPIEVYKRCAGEIEQYMDKALRKVLNLSPDNLSNVEGK